VSECYACNDSCRTPLEIVSCSAGGAFSCIYAKNDISKSNTTVATKISKRFKLLQLGRLQEIAFLILITKLDASAS
jgi:hypothetical protein